MEKHLINKLQAWMGNRTVIIATHRPAVMQLVDRILLVDNGKIARDGKKEELLVPAAPKAKPAAHQGKVNLSAQGESS